MGQRLIVQLQFLNQRRHELFVEDSPGHTERQVVSNGALKQERLLAEIAHMEKPILQVKFVTKSSRFFVVEFDMNRPS